MRKHRIGLLLILLVLAAAPGCRTLARAGLVAGAVALDLAASYYEEEPECDRHSAAPPTHRCR
jgi:hypothetical protein